MNKYLEQFRLVRGIMFFNNHLDEDESQFEPIENLHKVHMSIPLDILNRVVLNDPSTSVSNS